MSCGTVTATDLVDAFAFANDQVNKMKCQDPEILSKLCGGDNCLKWKDNDTQRIWPKPCLVTDFKCASDSDCENVSGAPVCQEDESRDNQKYCSYCPKDVTSGHCHISTQKLCEENSSLPYTCDTKTCKWKDKKDLNNKAYVEWRDEITCDPENAPCPQGLSCVDGKCQCQNDGQCPGAATCENGICTGGRCVMGNFLLRQWSENPQSRCTQNKDGSYPAGCKSDVQPGITDVPPFYYDPIRGDAFITADYCKHFGTQYNKKACSIDTDCKTDTPWHGDDQCKWDYAKAECTPKEFCSYQFQFGDLTLNQSCRTTQKTAPGDVCYNGYCTGEGSKCTETGGQKAGEFFLGKTLFRMFKARECPTKEKFRQELQENLKNFNNFPEVITSLADSQMMKSKNIAQRNFAADGINLYVIVWKKEAGITPIIKSGFVSEEVEKIFPGIVKIKDGLKFIRIKKSEIKDSRALKRIYLTLGSSDWLTQNISEAVINSKKS